MNSMTVMFSVLYYAQHLWAESNGIDLPIQQFRRGHQRRVHRVGEIDGNKSTSGQKHPIQVNRPRIPKMLTERQGNMVNEISMSETDYHKTLRKDSKEKKPKEPTSKTSKSSPNTSQTSKSKKQSILECIGDDFFPCHDNKGYFVCLFNAVFQEYETFCTNDKDVKAHNSNQADYCGMCSPEFQFIHESVLNSFDDISGSELAVSTTGQSYDVVYVAQFNEFDFISLAKSQELILSVDCLMTSDTYGQVKITFEKDIQSDLMSKMFPLGSLLVIDGSIFGSCNLNDADDIFGSLDGFLLLNQVSLTGQEATIVGEIATINHFFQNFSISYSLVGHRKLVTLGSTEIFTLEVVEPTDQDAPIVFSSKVRYESKHFITVAKHNFSFLSGTFDMEIETGWLLKGSFGAKVKFQVPYKIPPYDKNFLETWSYALCGLPVAPLLQSFFKKFLPVSDAANIAFGLYVRSPVNLKLGLESKLEIELGGVDISWSTGEKHILFTASSELGGHVSFLKDEPASTDATMATLAENGIKNLKLTPAKLSGFGGFMPQLVLLGFGLSTCKLGIRAGLFFEAKTSDTAPFLFNPVPEYPGLPWEVWCDSCHLLEADVAAGIADPFLSYSISTLSKKAEEKKIDLPKFEVKLPVVKMCLIDSTCPGSTTSTSSTTTTVTTSKPATTGTVTTKTTATTVTTVPSTLCKKSFGGVSYGGECLPVDECAKKVGYSPVRWEIGDSTPNCRLNACDVQCCVQIASTPQKICNALPLSDGRKGTCLDSSQCLETQGKELVPAMECEVFGSNCGVECCVSVETAELSVGVDTDLKNSTGSTNTRYEFELEVINIPVDVVEIHFEWTPGYGSDGFAFVGVNDRQAQDRIYISYPVPGTYEISIFAYNGLVQLATASIMVSIEGTTLDISAPENIIAGKENTYMFEAYGIPPTTNSIIFKWSFGRGGEGTGNTAVLPVNNRTSRTTTEFTYQYDGGYDLVVDVQDASTDEILAHQSVALIVGNYTKHNITYEVCDTWSATYSGGKGAWWIPHNISMIPIGAIFNLTFNVYDFPAIFRIEYPWENLVFSTGWRGNPHDDGYHGPIVGPGQGDQLDIFIHLTQVDYFRVYLVAEEDTGWDYEIQCRAPQSNLGSEQED